MIDDGILLARPVHRYTPPCPCLQSQHTRYHIILAHTFKILKPIFVSEMLEILLHGTAAKWGNVTIVTVFARELSQSDS